ncbi:MAG: hypothetical protein IJU76_12395 [Desulfovibrionaceae bacterium]|nr:hypothetical protein [Desulfovibrionaceae bacterium]
MNHTPLFPPLSHVAKDFLRDLNEKILAIRPLSHAHRQSLARDIADLSSILTVERRFLRKPYWSSPAFQSAYYLYFLPWNILRQVRLLLGLALPKPQENSVLFDLGSGPATFPLALWIARPDLRRIPLTIFLQDTANAPLAFGKKLLLAYLSLDKTPWTIHTLAQPLSRCVSIFREKKPFLVSAANVINELRFGEEEDLERLSDLLDSMIGEASHLLFLEPGTRQGGNIIARLRRILIAQGYNVLAPCTHDGPCPLLSAKPGPRWCHFTFDTEGAPRWLVQLSEEAGLGKETLSLAPLLVQRSGRGHVGGCRVFSQPFRVPGIPGLARYGCQGEGLVLLEDAAAYPSGTLLSDCVLGSARDAKSGALRAAPVGRTFGRTLDTRGKGIVGAKKKDAMRKHSAHGARNKKKERA